MDFPREHKRRVDSSKLRRTKSIASSKLRRTQSIAVVKSQAEDNSSMSSLGSFPEADIVAQQFANGKLSRQQTIAVDGSIFSISSHDHCREQKRKNKKSTSSQSTIHSKQCPHCMREFSNSWAVPKHVQRIHDRPDQFHCPRCDYKTPYQEWLQVHEKESHRKCPYCRQIYVLLSKHVGSCPKRPR